MVRSLLHHPGVWFRDRQGLHCAEELWLHMSHFPVRLGEDYKFLLYILSIKKMILLFLPTTCSATLIIIFILLYTVMNKWDEASLRADWRHA